MLFVSQIAGLLKAGYILSEMWVDVKHQILILQSDNIFGRRGQVCPYS